MTEKKYLAIRCQGAGIETTLQKLRRFIRQLRLADLVPAVMYERGAQSQRRREYYIVLEVHSELFNKPPRLEQFFREVQIGEPLWDQWLQESDLGEWLREPESTQFFRQIVRSNAVRKPAQPDDPFGRLDQEPAPVESAEAFNKLLYWLSARGSGTWQAFCDACEALKIAAKPRRVFRRLRLLGHAEYLDHGKRWQVCPPRVARSADGSYSYLIGQRTPSMLQTLPHQPVPQSNAPDLIKLSPEYAADSLSDLDVVSLRLAERLPRWRDLPQRWQKVNLPHLRYRIERWDGSDFRIHVERPDRIGMYRYTDQLEQHVFYDGSALRRGDWYGMQYLAEAHLGKFPQCRYSKAHHACWLSAHLPDLYERALVLASGRLPEPKGDGWLFTNVSSALMEALRARLDLSIQED